MGRATKEALTTAHLKTGEVETAVGTVLVRELTRWEMVEVFKLEENRQQQDTRAVSFGVVDPPMDEHEVAAWRKAAGNGEIERVAQKINELSGIGQGAAKSDLPTDGDDRPRI